MIAVNGLYTLVFVLSLVPSIAPMLWAWRLLLRLVLLFLMAHTIFTCYRMICLEGDEDMPHYNSRFKFVNDIRRRLDEKAEAGNKKEAEANEYKRRSAEARKNGVDVSKKLGGSKKKK